MATLTIAGQHQAAGIHEIRMAAFAAHAADATLTSTQATILRAATLALYAGPDSSGIWWVQCRDGWATGIAQADVDAYALAAMREVSWINTAEPATEFTDLVIARAKWAGLNFFKQRLSEPGSLMFSSPKVWDYDFGYGLTCAFPPGHFRAKWIHPTAMKLALDALGVPASV